MEFCPAHHSNHMFTVVLGRNWTFLGNFEASMRLGCVQVVAFLGCRDPVDQPMAGVPAIY